MKKFKRVLRDGSVSAADLARHLQVSPATVSQWEDEIRPIPIPRCVPIELFLGGAVTRRDLRPDDWQDIWPELANPQENTPPAPAVRAQAAINSDVCEVAPPPATQATPPLNGTGVAQCS